MRGEKQHLSIEEIEQLTGLAADVADGAMEGAMEHLDACAQCKRRMLLSQIGEVPKTGTPPQQSRDGSSPCPEEGRWVELAAGIMPQEYRLRWLEHAALCDKCGPLLKAAIEVVGMELTKQEEAKVVSLSSAQSEWQESLAARITGKTVPKAETEPKPTRTAKTFAFWPRWAFSFVAALLVAAIGWWIWVQFRTPSVEVLLAQAYTERRTIEVRIPGAKYAPMRVERGPSGSSLDNPRALLKAEDLISENLKLHPDDPAWLQAKARVDLLDGHYDAAIQSLQRALEAKPDAPELLSDLGSTYLERGDATGRTVDYGNAVEFLDKAIAKSPEDPVTLFNHAIACERLFFYAQAMADWEHYLRIDPKGGWANEAQASLQRVKKKMAEREKQATAPLLSPAEVVALVDANHEQAVAMLDQHAERYLEAAVHSWLPQAYNLSGDLQGTADDARRAIGYLAAMLKERHDDTWLADFLNTPVDSKALQSLLSSDDAFHNGRYGLSIERAQDSVHDFRRSGNQAGLFRASFSLMLAQTFALNFSDCLKTAAAIAPLLASRQYRWLQVQIFLQQGDCQAGMTQVDESLRSTIQGTDLASLSHYPGLELRATAFVAASLRDTGSADRGLHDLVKGLERFWQSGASNTRGENLYSVLFGLAGARNWHHLEALALAEKIADFPAKDPVDAAVSWQLLAGAEDRAGNYTAAQAILQHTEVQLANLPDDKAVTLRKAEIEVESAEIQLHRGDSNRALATLAKLREQFETTSGLFQAQYFKTYGEAYLALGFDSSAEPLLERALSVVETGLKSIQKEADRLQWSRTEGEVYRDLVSIRLKSETPAAAFALWEWYKAASLRAAATNDFTPFTAAASRSFVPPETASYSVPLETAVVSYAVLGNSITAFVFRDGNVESRVLPLPTNSSLQILRFLGLCADPQADMDTFHRESRRLYNLLIAPLETDLHGVTALRFETDGVLDHVPFELLKNQEGSYLADQFELSYSPGLAYRSQPERRNISSVSSALIVVAAEAQEASLSPLPEASEEGDDVAAYFKGPKKLFGVDATRVALLRNLATVSVFHFVGHAVAGSERVGLVLGAGALLTSTDLAKVKLPNLHLAVLSACDTANGAEGTISDLNSIARTLVAGGVSQVVASRWKVDSGVTRELMRAFYSNLTAGNTPADSLRAAIGAVRSLPGYQHPYYWGSFAVFGS